MTSLLATMRKVASGCPPLTAVAAVVSVFAVAATTAAAAAACVKETSKIGRLLPVPTIFSPRLALSLNAKAHTASRLRMI